MLRKNLFAHVHFLGSVLIFLVCFLSVELTKGNSVSFTVPKDYDPTNTISEARYKEGELIVRFAPKANGIQRTIAEKNAVLFGFGGGEVKNTFKLVPGLSVVKLPVSVKVADVLADFNKSGAILYAQPNYVLKALSTFLNDPNFNQLWGMHNTGQTGGTEDADIDAPQAWDIATDANDIIVAVIDSGIDYTHTDLAGNMWVNEAEANGIPGVDDDGNEYIDDVYGYDFCTKDDYFTDSDPMDDNGHGTHCAGTIGAVGNNAEGVAGICWNVRIMALKYLDSGGEGLTSDAIYCIEYAVDMGVKVLNNSWGGGDYNPSLLNHIEAAGANGVIFVASAGNPQNIFDPNNDTNPHYPASYDCNNIIAVMATDHNDQRSIWPVYERSSAYGPNSVDIGAPGSDILSCLPGDEYVYQDGTSMAAPHVAGACALVWRMNPALNHLEVKDIILDTVDETVPPLECVSQGRLNLYNAIVEAGTQAGKQAVILNKIDDVNGPVLPGDYITYTISFENTVRGPNDANFPFGDLTNVTIVDHLPAEVYCDNPFDPNYDFNEHTYTWNIGTLPEDDSNSLELTVVVNDLAEPLGKITNVCVIEANEIWPTTTIEVTDVNSWGGDVIYVDKSATNGANTGTSWHDAYIDLQNALQRARKGCGDKIWVAGGTYKPNQYLCDKINTFNLVNDVAVYGGFPPGGGQRKPAVYQTTLSGDIDDNNTPDIDRVVTASDDTFLIGFTITKGRNGIYCQDCNNVTVENCIISDNNSPITRGGGIYCENSDNVTITDCIITRNAALHGGGLYSKHSTLNVTNCVFTGNSLTTQIGTGAGMYNHDDSYVAITYCIFTGNSATRYGGGISSERSTMIVSYSVFTGNKANSNGGGMYNYDLSSVAIANCIFSGNTSNFGGGISNDYSGVSLGNCTFSGNWAYYGGGMYNMNSTINITNCILWANEAITDCNEIYYYPYYPTVTYSDVNGGWTGKGNINNDPCFFSVEQPAGSWTEDAFYDSSTFQSTLTDSDANWGVNELAGKFVNPDVDLYDCLQFFIVSNDVNTIKVWGDVTAIAREGDTYHIYDYHLTPDSECIDAGDPNFNPDPNMKDFDGERRVVDGDYNEIPIVDMGADEYYWSPADFNSDGFVNFFDYAFFSSAWQSDPNDPNYNEDCDLEDNNSIDYNDIALFCEDWLWQAAWAKAFPFAYDEVWGRSMSMGMGEGFFQSIEAKQAQPELTAADIEEIIKWLEELWLTDDEVRKMISEDEWLKFMEAVTQALKELIYN